MAGNAADYLCGRLADWGVSTIYGFPGDGINGILGALRRHQDRLRFVQTRGQALREYMRDYNHWTTVGVLNELLARPENRITIAAEADEYGIPVARMDYSLCDNDKANIDYSTKVITGILRAAGAQDVLTIHRYAHLIGGARMGTSPENSVVDCSQRAWAVPNLFLADGSVCPTQGSANPALTIMALSSRLAARMAAGTAMDGDPAARVGRARARQRAG